MLRNLIIIFAGMAVLSSCSQKMIVTSSETSTTPNITSQASIENKTKVNFNTVDAVKIGDTTNLRPATFAE